MTILLANLEGQAHLGKDYLESSRPFHLIGLTPKSKINNLFVLFSKAIKCKPRKNSIMVQPRILLHSRILKD